ncbi:MAG: hypothetical protein ACF8NJ_05975 [Phycisphaerales bacterium JB038]
MIKIRQLATILVLLALALGATQPDSSAPDVRTQILEGVSRYLVMHVVDPLTIQLYRANGVEIDLKEVVLPGVQLPVEGDLFYEQLSFFLANMLAGEHIHWFPVDKNRDSGTLYRAPDGLDINLELTRQGYAIYRHNPASLRGASAAAGKGAMERPFSEDRLEGDASPAAGAAETPDTSPDVVPGRPSTPVAERSSDPEREAAEVTAYITRTGSKYHRGSCSYLRQSKIPMDLEDAKRRYGPCCRRTAGVRVW